MTKTTQAANPGRLSGFLLILSAMVLGTGAMLAAEGLGIPSSRWGIGFGNSTRFTGLRFNLCDNHIEKIEGVNVTLWKPRKKAVSGTVNGLSLGLMPSAASLNGIQFGLLGVGAEDTLRGVTIGLIGAGSGEDMKGVNIGGIGVGCGENLVGLNLGGLGVGSGENVTGINIAGLGVGAGNRITGLNIGFLGVGAGERVCGITIAGLGAGAGERLTGLTICGLGAGAPEVRGLTIAGLGLGGEDLRGVHLTLGTVQVNDGGTMRGLAVSAFNHIRGTQKGVAIGIVNIARSLKGLQIGLVNIVYDNPAGRRVLPIVNFNF